MAEPSKTVADEPEKSSRERFDLAKWVMVFAFWMITVVGVSAIVAAALSEASKAQQIKDILSLLLPVVGAWVGTVMAFYFGRENFETASKSSADLVKQLTSDEKLKSILVKDAMLKISEAVTYQLEKLQKEIKLQSDLVEKLEKSKKERLPILDPQGCIKYIAHRSLFDKFIVEQVKKSKKIDELTLQDMLDDDKFRAVLKGFKTVMAKDNLQRAKALMDQDALCSDIFVTEDGTEKTKVVGWVTNVDIQEQSRV